MKLLFWGVAIHHLLLKKGVKKIDIFPNENIDLEQESPHNGAEVSAKTVPQWGLKCITRILGEL
jgi:hypothetical protein